MSPISTGAIGLISNPRSGHNREQFDSLAARIEHSDILHIVTRHPAEVPSALSRLRDAGVSVLAINGGDGTVSATLGEMLENRYFDTPPGIVVLPGGTANMNAGDVGMRGSLKRAVHRFCDRCDAGTLDRAPIANRALLRVADSSAIYHGMFLGAGAVIQGTEYAHREIHARGLRDDISLALSTLRTVWGVARGDPEFAGLQRIVMATDGSEAHAHDVRILAISTLHRLAFGMRPFWGSGPGALRITLMERDCSRFARTFFGIARGRPGANAVPAEGYFSHNANDVRLEMEGKVNLDGEILDVNGRLAVSATAPLAFLQL